MEDSRKVEKTVVTPFMAEAWKIAVRLPKGNGSSGTYCVSARTIKSHSAHLTELPKGMKFLRKVDKLIEDRRKMVFETDQLDWAMGELLATDLCLKKVLMCGFLDKMWSEVLFPTAMPCLK